MNDLMTKSFLSYVDLKRQAAKDLESGPEIEMGPGDERNLSDFFQQVNAVKSDMEEITNLLLNIRDLHEETKSTVSTRVLRGLGDQINSDMVAVLRKAGVIKTRLESLDRSNVENRGGSPVDRTITSVTNGLRVKLRDMMNDFQSLRETIVKEHREGLKKRYFNATGKEASKETIEKMVSGSGDGIFSGKTDLAMETKERHEAVKEIQRSLAELHKVFLDMAVLVETQGDQMNDIEQNVANAGVYVSSGTKELDRASKSNMKRSLACWIGLALLVLLLIFLISFLLRLL